MTFTMARDQYGATYHDLGPFPRKALLARLGRSHAARMFSDKSDGSAVATGYVIGGLRLTLYTVAPLEVAA